MGKIDYFRELGYQRGRRILQNGIEVQPTETFEEAFYEAELNARQYDDFTFIANELNCSDYPEEAWFHYEAGLQDALEQELSEREEDYAS